jgi:hypothetical protein
MLRMMFGWKLKKMILLIVPLTLGLTAWCASSPNWRRSSASPGTVARSPPAR